MTYICMGDINHSSGVYKHGTPFPVEKATPEEVAELLAIGSLKRPEDMASVTDLQKQIHDLEAMQAALIEQIEAAKQGIPPLAGSLASEPEPAPAAAKPAKASKAAAAEQDTIAEGLNL